MQYFSVYIDR